MPELPEVETIKNRFGRYLRSPLVITICLLRALAAFYILIDPVWGLIWSWILDVIVFFPNFLEAVFIWEIILPQVGIDSN